MSTLHKRFSEEILILSDIFGSGRVGKALPRLQEIYEHTERFWRAYVRRLPGGIVKYLLIAESAPWSDDGRPQFVLDPASRSRTLLNALKGAFFDASPRDSEEALLELARRGLLIVDSTPFAMDYSGKRYKNSYQRLLDRTAQTYLLRKLASHSLSWSPDLRVGLAFKCNGKAVISALGGWLRLPEIRRRLDTRLIAANGAGYPDANKLRAIFRLRRSPYNKRMQRTRRSVTHFAKRKMRATSPRR
jgi:hypothetical protein